MASQARWTPGFRISRERSALGPGWSALPPRRRRQTLFRASTSGEYPGLNQTTRVRRPRALKTSASRVICVLFPAPSVPEKAMIMFGEPLLLHPWWSLPGWARRPRGGRISPILADRKRAQRSSTCPEEASIERDLSWVAFPDVACSSPRTASPRVRVIRT